MSAISLEKLTKVYATGVRALDGLDLEVRDGEFVALVGPSGCGKTTALRLVAGLELITDGAVRFGGRVVNDVSPRQRDVAMVFQNYALYPHLTVAENIGFALTNQKIAKEERKRRVRSAAAALGLSDLLNRKPAQLSGGQRQRVAMGRAIVREPSVFLMDEPLSNLDAKLRVQMRSEVLRVHKAIGAATLYVTHDQVEAMTMGDRVAAPIALCTRNTSERIRTRSFASRLESGSSIKNTDGSRTIARPIATRCRCPPESCRGSRSR